MSSLTTLARPYAKAAFALAEEGQALPRWEEMLTLASAIAEDATMAELLDSPQVSSEQAARMIADTAGEAFDGRFSDFLAVLGANGRLALLPEVTRLFQGLRAEAEKRLRVRVVSAVPLEPDQSARMRDALARRFDCAIELENEIDKAVIGGAVVYAGDEVIDGSLSGRLQKLSSSLVR
ncbi:MAG: F0F1 ATP synthase subunit delta [Xanthomonadales bacterium]|jgi:F-type H+-transporting ATPase subunit delta|nr:F0F1 ATP synthase subunit delta [Xanthomonadales bacterium]